MIDLEYDPTSFVGPVDWRVVRFIESYRNHRFDPSYLGHIQQFHGGIPGKQYFLAQDGTTYRVGRFLTLVDEKTELQPPMRPSWEFRERDVRIDWSILTAIDEEGPSCQYLFGGEKFLPFAALRGTHHSDGYSIPGGHLNLVCFYYKSEELRPAVVVWLAHQALLEYMRWAKTDCDEVRYTDFTVGVAPHFDAFLELLRREP